MSRYVPLDHFHDPATDLYVPREWMAGIQRLFRFHRTPPACVVARTTPLSLKPNIFNTVPWDEVVIDTDGMFSPQTSPTQVTVRTTGHWFVAWTMAFGLTDDFTLYRETRCFRNRQEELIQANVEASNSRLYGPTRGFSIHLEEGEFLELDVWPASAGETSQDTSPPFFLGMHLIAAPALEELL